MTILEGHRACVTQGWLSQNGKPFEKALDHPCTPPSVSRVKTKFASHRQVVSTLRELDISRDLSSMRGPARRSFRIKNLEFESNEV